MSSISIGRYIREKLAAEPSLKTLKDKIYPVVATQGAEMPYIIYARTATKCDGTKDGYVRDTVGVTLSVVDRRYSKATEYLESVRKALEFSRGVIDDDTEVVDAEVTGSADNYVEQMDVVVVSMNMNFTTI